MSGCRVILSRNPAKMPKTGNLNQYILICVGAHRAQTSGVNKNSYDPGVSGSGNCMVELYCAEMSFPGQTTFRTNVAGHILASIRVTSIEALLSFKLERLMHRHAVCL